ncbi:MAG: hypothetical protein KAU41_09010 [Deltaproteobacteria bacterium]|nr:hypothetical protein [Deltaproteobacteria bacterium]
MKTSVFAIALIFLCSCSNVPKPASYPLSYQHKMQAAHHWDVLAEDVAKDVKLALQDPDALSGEQIDLGPIYLEQNKASLFGKVFDTLLITQLVNQKIELAKNKSNSLKLKYGTQIVKHCRNRHTSPLYPGEALLLTVLGHGIYKAFSANSDALGLFAAAGAVEVINGLEHDWTVPHHEIVITTELTRNDSVIARTSNIYYINDADFWHYANSWHNWGEEEELPIKKYKSANK